MIRGYHADIDPQKLGWEITFFAIVGLDSQKEAVLAAFEQLVARLARGAGVPHDPRRRRLPAEAGGARHLAREPAHPAADRAPTVSRVQTLQTIRTSKDEGGVPVLV